MKIIKRSGMEVDFDVTKIAAAVRKANNSVVDYEKITVCEKNPYLFWTDFKSGILY